VSLNNQPLSSCSLLSFLSFSFNTDSVFSFLSFSFNTDSVFSFLSFSFNTDSVFSFLSFFFNTDSVFSFNTDSVFSLLSFSNFSLVLDSEVNLVDFHTLYFNLMLFNVNLVLNLVADFSFVPDFDLMLMNSNLLLLDSSFVSMNFDPVVMSSVLVTIGTSIEGLGIVFQISDG
jgi:hypothetical protein